ncbi:SOUL family heme-binding protein [Hyphobacterium sp.]|uniref:SOUL family heme-binding protein n=1 Tax=Hyphobacterium sp. TaxID=2004662 RepID=UPI003BA8580F
MRFIALFAALIVSSAAMAAEEPAFTSVARDGNIEVRDYASMIVAEVQVRGSRGRASSAGFRPLADFIFGNNAPRQEIDMTAPVTTTRGQEIAMTAPVTSTEATDGIWTVGFVMPSEYTMETLPEPNNPAVQLREVPGRRMVVIEFNGARTSDRLDTHLNELESWLAAQGYEAVGEAEYASYSAPWVPTPFKRHEIMIEVVPSN